MARQPLFYINDEHPLFYINDFDFGGIGQRKESKIEKAKQFLKRWLTDEEYENLQNDGLIIPSKIYDGRTYKVKKHANIMVEVYNYGELDHKLCAVDKSGKYENDDTVLAKILMLKANEKEFLKIAEKHELNIFSVADLGGSWYVGTPDTLTITWTIGEGMSFTHVAEPIPAGSFVRPDNEGHIVRWNPASDTSEAGTS